MKALPKITIITPSFNQGDYIEETIESVLSQNYPHLEYIVLDGGSTDNTIKVLQKHADNIIWHSESDNGQSDALNKGFRMATGEIIAFLNSDDRYEPGALDYIGRYFSENPHVDWLSGRCRNINGAGEEIRKPIMHYKNFWLRFSSRRVLQVLNYVSQPATFWRRKLFDQVGGLDEGLHYAMDYDYWMRLGQNCKLKTVDRYLAHFRIHQGSKAGSSASAQFESELLIAQRYVGSRLLMGMHRMHTALIVAVYQVLLHREMGNGHSESPAQSITSTMLGEINLD